MEEINIIIIEDKKEDAVFLESLLKPQGYNVWVASSGEEAMKILKNNASFSAIITELHMSGMNGMEVVQGALKIYPNISVVVITMAGFIDSAVEAMEKGAYGYVTKPFNTREIKITVRRAIERHYLLSTDKEREGLAELSIKDSLTGVYNRRFLKIYLQNEIGMVRRTSGKFSLLMIDIDNFKKYNDTNGHLAGDQLLREISRAFQDSLRQEDIVFRYGGEEFMIYLGNTDKKGAALVAERTRNSISLFMPVTVSIGVGTFPEDGEKLEELISSVDQALYKAKEQGRNRVCIVE